MLKLDKNKKYILACSYGPDSMALLHMLLKEDYNFIVAHVNYHFRKESDLEERGLEEYCNSHNIKLYVYDNDEKVTKNLEAKARDIRYQFFKKIYDKEKCDALLVAHHEDDLIETYILQKRRKLKVFYYGIKCFSEIYDLNLIRPLLNYNKVDLTNYCKKNDVPYCIDSSNLSDDFLRNRIRHEIIDNLTKLDRIKWLTKIYKDNEHVNSILRSFVGKNLEDINVLKGLSNEEFRYAIYLLAEKAQIFKISNSNLNEIHKIVLSDKPNVFIQYRDYLFVKEYGDVYFTKDMFNNNEYLFNIENKTILDTPFFFLNFMGDTSNRNVSDKDYPLVIRNAYPDDVVKIKDYYKPIRRLFIDWKMPTRLRKRWPVILNSKGKIIYIPRYRPDYIVKDSDNFFVK